MNAITPIIPADLAFTAKVEPIYDEYGQKVSTEIGQRVVRDDTNQTIAMCGPNFHPVQHRDILDPITDWFAENGYAVQTRDHSRHALYDLKGQKGAWIQHGFARNGAVMRTDIITGDFITPTGRTSYLDQGPDTMLFKISVLNSHNGSLAVRALTSYERLICMNGMTSTQFSAGVYGKHTANFSLKAMTAQIENALNGMEYDAERFGLWAAKKITHEVAETMLKRTIARLPKQGGKEHHSQPLVTKILDRFRHEDQTVWGLFQAVTWWQSHGEMKQGAIPLTTRLGRENKVAAMLSSRAWQEVAA